MSSKFFVIQLSADARIYDTEDEAIEDAKAAATVNPGVMFIVADQDDTVIVPKPDPVVTKVE